MTSRRTFKGLISFLTCILCLVTSGLAKSQDSPPLKVEDAVGGRAFGQLMPITLSPGGKWLAYTVKDNRRTEKGDMETWARTGVRFVFTGTDVWISNMETAETRNLTGGKGANFLPAWSPDGHLLAFLSDRDGSGQAKLWVWDAVKNELKRASDVDIRAEQIVWTPDSRRILVTTLPQGVSLEEYVRKRVSNTAGQKPKGDQTGGATVVLHTSTGVNAQSLNEAPRSDPWNLNWTLRDLMLIDVPSGNGIVLVRNQKIMKFLLSPDGLRVAYTNQKRFEKAGSQQILFDLATVDLSVAQERIVASDIPLGFTGEFSWSPRGTQLAYLLSGQAERTNDCYLVDADGRNSRNLTSFSPHPWRRHSEIPLWDSQGRQIYFVRDGALWRASVDQSGPVEVAGVPGRQIIKMIPQSDGRLWTLEGGKSTVVLTHDNSSKQDGFYKIELHSGKTTRLLEKGQCYTCMNVNEGQSVTVTGDQEHVIYYAEDAAHDSDLYISNAFFQTPRRLTHLNAQLDEYRMGSARLIDWLSDDGEPLQGALLLPVDYHEGKRYPLIAWVYGGGSRSNDFGHFGFEGSGAFNMQLLATRGYAVLSPDAPQHLGTPMLDLTKTILPGINKAIELGIADPNRLGVIGHSYGGYSAVSLIVQTQRFKAAVAGDGFADLVGAYGQMSDDGTTYQTAIAEAGQTLMGGTPWQVRDKYIENSPIFYLDRVETPLLLVHGSKDLAVAPFLGDELFVALRRLGKHVEYAKYLGEDHSPLYWSYANEVDLCNRMIAWFEKYLGGENPEAGAFLPGHRAL